MPSKKPVQSSEHLDAVTLTPQLDLTAKSSELPSPAPEDSAPDLTGLNVFQRILLVRKNLPSIETDKNVDGKYDVVTHQNINSFLRPLLNRYGLVDFISQISSETVPTGVTTNKGNPYLHNRGIYQYTVINVDNMKQALSIRVEGWGEDTGDKAPGKAQTYAFKTGRTKVFSIAAGDNEEDRISDKDKFATPTLSAEQISSIMELADDLFGDDADLKIKMMLDKVFFVEKLADIPTNLYPVAEARLKKHKELLQNKGKPTKDDVA